MVSLDQVFLTVYIGSGFASAGPVRWCAYSLSCAAVRLQSEDVWPGTCLEVEGGHVDVNEFFSLVLRPISDSLGSQSGVTCKVKLIFMRIGVSQQRLQFDTGN